MRCEQRGRKTPVEAQFGTASIWVADLTDIIRSKRAVGGKRTLPYSTSSKRRKMKKKKTKSRKSVLLALKKESERAVLEQIRLLLSLPMNRRTHFLRVRLPN